MENIHLSLMPERTKKPRTTGVAMVMDKGLSIREAEDFVSVSGELTDFMKLGFGTSVVTPNVKEKIKVYQNAGIRVYLGGTLFEAFLIRNMEDEYRRFIDDLGLDTIEISDGSMRIDHAKKCEVIHELSKNYTVFSEVGAKEAGILIAPAKWIEMMENELSAGAFKVIAEARESGTAGIYRPSGKAHTMLINMILSKIPIDQILWEAPLKSQQAWFIQHFGANVNLGNIPPNEVIPLETLRLGLRGDTFFRFLPEEYKKFKLE
jgi:phosphosulfolactate synthase